MTEHGEKQETNAYQRKIRMGKPMDDDERPSLSLFHVLYLQREVKQKQ